MAHPGSFELACEDVADSVRIIALTGEADRLRTDEVSEAIEEARRVGRHVVVDLSAVTYMDSSMLATFVAASEQGRRRSERFVVLCESPRVRRSLEIKGLETILHLVQTRDEALASASGDRGRPGRNQA